MKSATLRDMMLAIANSDAATTEQRTRAAFLAQRFDPDFDPVAWLRNSNPFSGAFG